ncbi:N-acetyltransferase [Selenomonas sp.]|jgi:amino-acid N-acetyltransferase|uniref:N-acetyltransferase n=1 Tax=Selenomonas sp. TaxID=2053611 RepID=UPI003A102732
MKYRKATFADIEAIFALVNDYAGDGVMLARSRNTLYETLRDMIVAEDDAGEIVGVGGLHILWDRLAEIRTMAVSPRLMRHGIGGEIVRRLMAEGRTLGVEKFFTLTYKPGFFQTLGFHTVTKDALPQKVWKDCIDCPKFPNCDEIAMVKLNGVAEDTSGQ